MNSFFKKAEEMGNNLMANMMGESSPQKKSRSKATADKPRGEPVTTGMCDVIVTVNIAPDIPIVRHQMYIDVGATVAAFQTQVYMLTGVIPSRQSIAGFPSLDGGALAPDADIRKLGLHKGCLLTLTQLKPGQEVQPAHALTSHAVDIVAAKASIMSELIDAVEAVALVQHHHRENSSLERLTKLCMYYEEGAMKLLLKVDELGGDANVKAARKVLVVKLNQLLDRLEKLKQRLSPSSEGSEKASVAAAAGAHDATVDGSGKDCVGEEAIAHKARDSVPENGSGSEAGAATGGPEAVHSKRGRQSVD